MLISVQLGVLTIINNLIPSINIDKSISHLIDDCFSVIDILGRVYYKMVVVKVRIWRTLRGLNFNLPG